MYILRSVWGHHGWPSLPCPQKQWENWFHKLETGTLEQGQEWSFHYCHLSSFAKVKLERPVQVKQLRKGWETGDKVLICVRENHLC